MIDVCDYNANVVFSYFVSFYRESSNILCTTIRCRFFIYIWKQQKSAPKEIGCEWINFFHFFVGSKCTKNAINKLCLRMEVKVNHCTLGCARKTLFPFKKRKKEISSQSTRNYSTMPRFGLFAIVSFQTQIFGDEKPVKVVQQLFHPYCLIAWRYMTQPNISVSISKSLCQNTKMISASLQFECIISNFTDQKLLFGDIISYEKVLFLTTNRNENRWHRLTHIG